MCVWAEKYIYKVTKLKVHSKGRYFVLKKAIFKNYSERRSSGLQSCFPVFVTSQIVNPAYGNSTGWVGRMLGWALHISKSKPNAVFLYHCISDENQLFSENVGCHFHFILHIMSEKAAFVSGALICVQRYRGNLELSRSNSTSCWQIITLHICVATNSASLWDYSINKLNCITASVQFVCIMLELKNNKHNTEYRCTYLYMVNAVICKHVVDIPSKTWFSQNKKLK